MGCGEVSFVRPEVAGLFQRWLETAIYVGITGFGVYWLLTAGPADLFWRWGLAAAVAVIGFWFIRSAALSAMTRGDGEAPGVVQIDERRVAFFGPHAGGVVSINDIFAIEIWAADEAHWRYEPEWVLRWSETEPALIIPISAQGADALADAFTALPGFAAEKAVAALKAPVGATVTIWRRAAMPDAPALARPDGRA